MTQTLVTRAKIEAEIIRLRTEQRRLPIHWVDEREVIARQLEGLVLEWLACDG
jgi:hypothetical protein